MCAVLVPEGQQQADPYCSLFRPENKAGSLKTIIVVVCVYTYICTRMPLLTGLNT